MMIKIHDDRSARATRRLWDISPKVWVGAPVFAGDTAYAQTWQARISPNCPVNVARIEISPHAGAHADAPLHYDPQGLPVGGLDLDDFIGPCRVIHCMNAKSLVRWEDVANTIALPKLPPRVLLRTYVQMPQTHFDSDLVAIDPALIERLAQMGVRLIGIDSASIDPASSKDLPSHQAIRRLNLRVLENLCLDDVAAGDYELIALPVKWVDADAAPVRAVLREWENL